MSAEVRATIHELENRRCRAMCEKDTASLRELLADCLVYTHSTAVVDDKSSYIGGVGSRWNYQRVERPVEDIQVHGDCAVVTGEVRMDVVTASGVRNMHSRYVDVWVKSGKGWQMVAWQSTPVPAKV